MTRTDIHRPSAIVPDEYEFVAFDYIGPSYDGPDVLGQRMLFRAHRERTGGRFSGHEHGGTCHVCGATAFYVARFYHAKTNAYITTGEDCAANLEMGDPGRFRSWRVRVAENVSAAKTLRAGKAKAEATLTEAGLAAAWALYTATDTTGWKYEEVTASDIVGKLVRYGSVSDRALEYLRGLMGKIANRPALDAARKAETDAAAPVPVTADRITVEGVILALKGVDTDFGHVTKMLVRTDAGWKVWGKVPARLEPVKGDRVRFKARVEPSHDDPKFGFFSRPASPENLGGGGAA
jgi:hypothetical protein